MKVFLLVFGVIVFSYSWLKGTDSIAKCMGAKDRGYPTSIQQSLLLRAFAWYGFSAVTVIYLISVYNTGE